jgi:hypothetical protein
MAVVMCGGGVVTEVESVVVDSVVYDHSGSSDGAKHKTKQQHGRGY